MVNIILRFGLYDLTAKNAQLRNREHYEIWRLEDRADPWKVLIEGFWKEKGRSLVTVSTCEHIRSDVFDAIQKETEDMLDVIDLSFQSTGTRRINKIGKKEATFMISRQPG
ncbi:hypothetical protein BO71DRAFT_409288 [Aspergillus ellipticus CBS 707.79]|uniref:Uncharacterized protein n=1 Tax=Aspergillus ellipticus CBS 707.79 TaxID=1448320 RepID=A0A319DAM2_9EURO|nr:hypothetical protein BO71DRAFT_409288 [Aspergillus ellipticus CBS 707.79]